MIDIKTLSADLAEVKKALAKKGYNGDLDAILKMDQERRNLIAKTDELKAEQNKLAKEIPQAQNKELLLKQSQAIKDQLKQAEPELKDLEIKLHQLLLEVPNPPLPAVPEGKDDENNLVMRTHGSKPQFDFTPLDHVELALKHDLLDLETAAKVSGTRFYYLKNEAVQLEFALVQFVLNKLISKGFTPIIPPVLVKEHAMEATGFFPAERNEIYSVNPGEDDLYLVGTSEVPLTMLHANQILKSDQLPLRYTAFSSCFRREAGTYGKDTHGIIRVHQFDKIEMFSYCHSNESQKEHEHILAIEEEIMQELGFHYQVVNICGGDLGAPAAQKYDIEVWIPSQNKFRELTSCSNCTDFQSRRAKIRFTAPDGKHLAHTLNGTAIAITRTLVALLENHQQADGSIAIPEVLQGYMGGKTKIGKK